MPLTSLLTKLQDASTKVLFGTDSGTEKSSFYDLVDRDMQGNEVKMETFKGDVLCVGTHEEILDFVETNFGAKDKFIWFEKGQVNGKNTREVYSFLKDKLPSEDGTKDVRWNFAKFLVDHEGKPIKRYGPKTNPEEIVPDIEELLAKRNSK
ncbi:hypothetical protein ACHAXM_002935 [Skeletonema potamos]